MHLLITVAVVLQVISAVAIIVLVLLQHGKGADMGAAFGGGASGSLFGATGSANFLSRSTAVASTIFFCATLALTFGGQVRKAPAAGGVLSTVTTEQKAPAQPASPVPVTNTSDFTNKPAQNQIPR
jgi:preprotein translocase, secG subunit